MNISDILTPETTFCGLQLSSKKKVIEKISQVMAESIDCSAQCIYECLFARERIGTTGLGKGIAIPHGRTGKCTKPIAVFILLDEPVEYDAPDGQPVDIIFSILVPEKADDKQLQCLTEIANILSKPNLSSQIRHAHCHQALYDIIETAVEKFNQNATNE